MNAPLAWLDGALVPRAEARISIDDFAVRYGAACFETMFAVDGRVFRLDRHLARLHRGLREMGVEPPREDRIAAALSETLRANGLARAQLRVTATAGRGGAPDLAVARAPSVFVTVDAIGDAAPAPVRLRVVSLRLDERRALRGAKVAQFLPYLLARQEARASGADDGLLLNRAGAVCESATANVFAVIGGRLVTPALDDGPLPGVTREVILECARSLGMDACERTLALDELASADELFLTASVPWLRPVSAVVPDDATVWQLPVAPGPLTGRLAREYATVIARECGSPES